MDPGEKIKAIKVSQVAGPTQPFDVRISVVTLLKLSAFVLVAWAAAKLWSGFLLFLIALLLAVTLHPVVMWMERKRIPRALAVCILALGAAALVVTVAMFLMPPLTTQLTNLVQNYPNFRLKLLKQIPIQHAFVQRTVAKMLELPTGPEVSEILSQSLVWGQAALTNIVAGAIVLILTMYLLLDGKSMYAWLLAFVPRSHREKMATTVDEVSDVVHAYVSGQMFAVALFTVFSLVVLSVAGVPAAVPLAIIAGLCDVIPVLGIILATAPAMLMALTISPMASVWVFVAYFSYHLFETYFLLPRIYGSKLRLSTLSVLLALMAGVTLQGIIGALLVLPLVAVYPIIERHWLAGYLQPRVLTDHSALADAAETDSDAAIDAVLLGEKHASEESAATTTARFQRAAKGGDAEV